MKTGKDYIRVLNIEEKTEYIIKLKNRILEPKDMNIKVLENGNIYYSYISKQFDEKEYYNINLIK